MRRRGLALGLGVAICVAVPSQVLALTCDEESEIAPGVTLCTVSSPVDAFVIRVEREDSPFEFRVLANETPLTDVDGWPVGEFYTTTVQELAATHWPPAIVAINGGTWEPTHGFFPDEVVTPSGSLVTNYSPRMVSIVSDAETIVRLDETDPDGQLDLTLEAGPVGGDVLEAWFYAVGSVSPVASAGRIFLDDGVCATSAAFGQGDTRTALGYSDEVVVLVSVSQEDASADIDDLCAIFEDAGVDAAVNLDGGTSTTLVVDGTVLNPLIGWRKFLINNFFGGDGDDEQRWVANAIGLVPVREYACEDGQDDDGDGLVDCDDIDCECYPWPAADGERDPWLWPHSADSIWNMPIGAEADYGDTPAFTPVTTNPGDHVGVDIEYHVRVPDGSPDCLFLEPEDGDTEYWEDRCPDADESAVRVTRGEWPVPDSFELDDADPPHTPNNTVAFLEPDLDSVIQVGGVCREPGAAVNGWLWPVDTATRREDQLLSAAGMYGAHGGSHLSALGGSIRPGELTTDADPIHHALKLNVFADELLHYDDCTCASDTCSPPCQGYTWPAVAADDYAATSYGGADPTLVMGSLLAIPPEYSAESLGLRTDPARRLFGAMQDYGVYVVDDSGWAAFDLPVSYDANGEFEEYYGYAIGQGPYATGNALDWYLDVMALIGALHVVQNNSPTRVGGGGEPRALLAPALGEVDTTPPGVPTGLVATYPRATSVDLSWEDPGDADILGYVVEQQTESGWTRVASTWGATTARIEGLMADTDYEFRVFARDMGLTDGEPCDTVTTRTLFLGVDEDFEDREANGWDLDGSASIEDYGDGAGLWFGDWQESSAALYAERDFSANLGFVVTARIESSAEAAANLTRLVFLDNGAANTCFVEFSGGEDNTVALACQVYGVESERVEYAGSFSILDGPLIEVEVEPGPTVTIYGIVGSERLTLFDSVSLSARSAGNVGVRGEWTGGFIDDVVVTLNSEYVEPTGVGFDYPVGEPEVLGGDGYVTQSNDGDGWYNYQEFTESGHCGEDWNGEGGGDSDYGEPVYAVADGVVEYADHGGSGWGNIVLVAHELSGEADPDYDIVQSQYAHLSVMYVSAGDLVLRGDLLGQIGNADGAYAAHLHFELRWDETQDPGGSAYDCWDTSTGMTDPSDFIDAHRP